MPNRILIVDDDEDTRRMAALILRRPGYEIEEVASGAEALEAVQRNRPDLVLLDVMMPDIDGHEVARRLRDNPETASIQVVMLTAKAQPVNRAEGLLAGADEYLTKPIDPVELDQRITALLKKPEIPRKPDELLAEAAQATSTALDGALTWLFVASFRGRVLRSAAMGGAGAREALEAVSHAARSSAGTLSLPLAPNISPLSDVLLQAKPITNALLSALAARPGGEVLARGLEAAGMESVSILPLIVRGQPMGTLLLARPRGTALLNERLIGLVADRAATAIENARLIEELDRRAAEARRAQVFHQTLINMMGDGLVMLDAQGRIQFVNRRLLRMLGYEESQLLGRDFVSLIHPADQVSVRALLDRKAAATSSFEKRILRSNGTLLPALAVFVPSSAVGGDVGDIVVVSDLSEQKAREAALEKKNLELAALYHAARAMSSSLNLDAVPMTILEKAVEALKARGGSILLRDEATGDLVFRAAIGPGSEKLIGVHVPVGKGVAGWVAQHAESALVAEGHSDPRWYSAIDQTTGLTTTSIIAVPLRIKREVIGVLELVNKQEGLFDEEDLTLLETLAQSSAVAIDNARLYRNLREHAVELERAYEELKEADRLKDELIQNVSHELRTPLTFILGYVELMLAGELGPITDEQKQGLEIVRNKGRALTKVVGDIVTLQRMNLGALQMRPTRLQEVVDNAVQGCMLAANQAGIQIEVVSPGPLPAILADEERLGQVMDNLLSNAIKFSPNGGKIRVRLQDAGADLKVEVADSGIGIPPDKLGKIFERFYQVDGSATRRFGGVGLGLAICKEIVEAHGGQIWAESQLGQGASFFFTLPKDPAVDRRKPR